MKSGKLLCLDLSTNSTGYAVFDVKSKKVLRYGAIKPKVAGISKLKYPIGALMKIIDVSSKVKDLVSEEQPDWIMIEEINRGINRIGQKSLDALHFFVLDYLRMIDKNWLEKVEYMDSDGRTGWRKRLGLELSEADKFHNKNARAAKNKKGIIDKKVLAERFVNKKYGVKFDVVLNPEEADIVDAIGLGCAKLGIK